MVFSYRRSKKVKGNEIFNYYIYFDVQIFFGNNFINFRKKLN